MGCPGVGPIYNAPQPPTITRAPVTDSRVKNGQNQPQNDISCLPFRVSPSFIVFDCHVLPWAPLWYIYKHRHTHKGRKSVVLNQRTCPPPPLVKCNDQQCSPPLDQQVVVGQHFQPKSAV